MRLLSKFKKIIFVITVLAIASCASTNLPPISPGKSFEAEYDEERVWEDCAKIEQAIEKSGLVYEDQELESYLNALAEKLSGPNLHGTGLKPRVKVIKNPFLNAVALPCGAIYLHTGILARMENEAQLATVLGHELTHFTHRHSIKGIRIAKNRAAVANVLQVLLGGMGGPGLRDLTGEAGELWVMSSVNGYSRELETEADVEGLRAMVQNGYDPNEASRVFYHLQQDLDQKKITEPFFMGTHPVLQDRIDSYNRLISTQYATEAKESGRLKNTEEFLGKTAALLLENAVLDLRIGRPGTARAALEKYIKRKPETARAHFLMGEVSRRVPDDQKAITAYREAVRRDPAYAEPHRELGLIYRALGRVKDARNEFKTYLVLDPKAVDGPIIKGYLEESDKR